MRYCFGIPNREEQLQAYGNMPYLVAVDVETVDLKGAAIGLAIAPCPAYSFFLTIDQEEWKDIVSPRRCIFHNAKFDLAKLGLDLEFEDTYLLHKALGEEEAGLHVLAWDMGLIEMPTAKGLMKKHKAKDMNGVPIEEIAAMCCRHAMATYFLWEGVTVPAVYETIDKPMVRVLMDMEARGVLIDRDEIARQMQEQKAIIDERRNQFVSACGSVNLNSPAQLKVILGTENTDKRTLAKLGTYATQVLGEYRRANKALTTYLLPFSEVDADGRIRSDYDYTRTARLRSSEPNMQNLTRGELRKIVVAEKGKVFLDVDFEQLELRVAAHVSGDKIMNEALKNDEDLHARTAMEAFGTVDRRYEGKVLNFGVMLYGASAWKAAELIGCSEEEGELIHKKLTSAYPEFNEFVNETKRFARHNFYVETIFGRKRKVRDITSASNRVREHGLREAVNTTIQSPAADIVKMAMLELADLPLVMQVHDELIFEVDEDDVEKLSKRVKETCENIYPLSCGLRAKVQIGKNYYECH